MLTRVHGGLRLVVYGAVLFCAANGTVAGELLITVLRSSDPVEVRNLLGSNRPGVQVPAGRNRDYRTAGSGRRHHDLWQIVVSERQAAFLAAGSTVSQLHVPWVELTRRRPVPHVSLEARERVRGIRVQAERVKQGVEVRLDYIAEGPNLPGGASGEAGVTVSTTLRGKPGQWLDAGGDLVLEALPSGGRQYRASGIDPRRFRLLVRVDVPD